MKGRGYSAGPLVAVSIEVAAGVVYVPLLTEELVLFNTSLPGLST